MDIFIRIVTLLKLGVGNLCRVLFYVLSLKTGYLRRRLKTAKPVTGRFYLGTFLKSGHQTALKIDIVPNIYAFGWKKVSSEDTPQWHRSILTEKEHQQATAHWTEASNFSNEIGDIKGVWELSKFNWLTKFVLLAITESDEKWIEKANEWIENWSQHNPLNIGPNWGCGQEASVRVINMLLASYLLNEVSEPTAPLTNLIKQHLSRISPTIHYAIAQDNNHGTSEAAALFLGGAFLHSVNNDVSAKRWEVKGRSILENRVKKLIMNDGSFSMYSINYHRVMLDTLCLVEIWRQKLGLGPFSAQFHHRAKLATMWLLSMIGNQEGDVPNIGANDGARIIDLSESDIRDFRPSVQLAATLFLKKRAFREKGSYDFPIELLGLSNQEENIASPGNVIFSEGGYAVLRNELASAYMRFPKYKFRPGHSDALHVDLIIGNKYVLRDGGTYSYACEQPLYDYFSGVESHNSVQFDNRDQMHKLSRFLFGSWLKSNPDSQVVIENDCNGFSASYKDYSGATHERKIRLYNDKLVIIDNISGFKEQAILRWRLYPGPWQLKGNVLEYDDFSISVWSNNQIESIELTEDWESLYYYKKDLIPILKITLLKQSIITTEIRWS